MDYLEQGGKKEEFKRVLYTEVFGQGWESLKIFVPACLYVLQNNLLFIALSKIDAATYQVTYQLKILTTAIFSVLLLKKHIDAKKWISLVILTVGVSCVQLSGVSSDSATITPDGQIIGFFCIIGACLLSGLAGVYLELVLKFSKPSVWVRNIQLSLFSLIPALIAVSWTDGAVVLEKGFFYGYSPIVWFVIILQACSGLLVALVVKYADNILKGFATSISIVVSSLFTMLFFDFEPSVQWIFGAFLVILSTILYSIGAAPPPSTPTSTLPTKIITKPVNV